MSDIRYPIENLNIGSNRDAMQNLVSVWDRTKKHLTLFVTAGGWFFMSHLKQWPRFFKNKFD